MPKEEPTQPEVVVPWWQDGDAVSDQLKEPYFLSKGVTRFFALLKSWLLFPLQQTDALTCSESLLTLLAWDRDITRFKDEPLSLFRKRVKFAAINAKDAGSVAGFKAVFERLELGIVSFEERASLTEWDICTIELTDIDIAKNSKLIQILIEQYGRTCRRYRIEVRYPTYIQMGCFIFSHRFAIYTAREKVVGGVHVQPQKIAHDVQVFVASLP